TALPTGGDGKLLATRQAGGHTDDTDARAVWREDHGRAPRGGPAALGSRPRRAPPHASRSDPQRRGGGARARPEGVLRPMKKFASVAAYLRAVPPVPRAVLQQLSRTIKAAAPQATEVTSHR